MTIDVTKLQLDHYDVIGCAGRSHRSNVLWKVKCKYCNEIKDLEATYLRQNYPCKCTNIKHGLTMQSSGGANSPEHKILMSLIARCTDPSSPGYHRYGAKGITVCNRWLQGGVAVFVQDMGLRPSPELSIDRIDNKGNYEPINCRWATPRQQTNNRDCTIMLTHEGRTLPLTEWAEIVAISDGILRRRVTELCWSHSKALTTPVAYRRSRSLKAPDGHKYCSHCHKLKLLADFPHNRSTVDGYHPQCKVCVYK